MQSYAHRCIFRTTSNIYIGAFFTLVKPYFKNKLNPIELSLSSFFKQLTLSWKNLQLWKLWEKKSLVNNGTFFLKLRSGMAPSINRSSHQRCSIRKDGLRNFVKFTGKHLHQGLFKKKRLWHRCFPVNLAKFLWTHFGQKNSGRLLLIKKIF